MLELIDLLFNFRKGNKQGDLLLFFLDNLFKEIFFKSRNKHNTNYKQTFFSGSRDEYQLHYHNDE